MRRASLLALLLLAATPLTLAQAPDTAQSAAADQHLDGLFPLSWQAKAGKLLLTIPAGMLAKGQQFLLLDTLRHGVGANDLALDRGQLGEGRLVQWYRSGPKLLLIQPNLDYRSSSANADESESVSNSFAESVLWGFKVDTESPDGSVTVDATDFFLHDIHSVGDRLREAKQGAYRLDAAALRHRHSQLERFPAQYRGRVVADLQR